jgi:hypothetical protein
MLGFFKSKKKRGLYVPVGEVQAHEGSETNVEVIVRDRRRSCHNTCTILFSFLAGLIVSMVLMALLQARILRNKDLGKVKPYIDRMSAHCLRPPVRLVGRSGEI